MGRAVFLDRDGTLNEEVGHITRPEELILLPVAITALKTLVSNGFKTIVISNQSAVARGLISEDALHSIHSSMRERLTAQGAHLDAIYYCPHHPEVGTPPYRAKCNCRKPGTELIERAAREHDLTLADCFVVGDRYHDVGMAHAVGAQGVLVLTGHGKSEVAAQPARISDLPDFIAKDVLDAALWIIGQTT
jgi:D-glycero-D-manno-heptose 1,7-bisphosphate phosphatase